jgi:hypothetical protein
MCHKLPADLCDLTAAARLIHDGKLRPDALMAASLDRIAIRDLTEWR